MDLLSLTYSQLLEIFQDRYGRGAYHATALYRAFYANADFKARDLPAFTTSPGLAAQVANDLGHQLPSIIQRAEEEGVTKLVFQLADGLAVETVTIPMPGYTTVCISCQVGCRMGCLLCQTGQMGFRRHLSAAEIVAQVHAVQVLLGCQVRNVVFMGMGEPLDNFENVVQAIRVMEDQRGLNIAKRHITVSTCGVVEGIHRLAGLNWPQLRLAISLNAAQDELRSALMPINRRWGLDELKQALLSYPLARGNVLFIEYVLIKGVNDQPEHAHQLAQFLEGLCVRLNLIVYNSRRDSPYEAPGEADVDRFYQDLVRRKIFVRLRHSKGAGIRAACGQLGGREMSLP